MPSFHLVVVGSGGGWAARLLLVGNHVLACADVVIGVAEVACRWGRYNHLCNWLGSMHDLHLRCTLHLNLHICIARACQYQLVRHTTTTTGWMDYPWRGIPGTPQRGQLLCKRVNVSRYPPTATVGSWGHPRETVMRATTCAIMYWVLSTHPG
jgi:hypothetical protein